MVPVVKPALGGVTEVAAALGVTRQRLAALRERPGFPEPIAELSAGPVWDLEQVHRWATSSRGRRGRPSSTEAALLLGNRFQVEPGPIGSGGFADVFRALDLKRVTEGEDDTVVAVKVLRAVEPGDAQVRFSRELRVLGELHHPNIVEVIDSGTDVLGRPWYAMALAKGSLADELGNIENDADVVDIMRQVCTGVAFLHEHEVWHRDITPMNVLRTRTFAWAISDFGLAREAERRTPTLTSTTTPLGTFLYQAPETMIDAKAADHRADIYGLGKVLEALALRHHPLPGGEQPEGPFRPIIRKATKFQPDERYQHVVEMLCDIERAVAAPKGRWETGDEALARLRLMILDGSVAMPILDEFMTAAGVQSTPGRMDQEVSVVAAHLNNAQIAHLWQRDPDAFRAMFAAFSEAVGCYAYNFSFCDVLAEFGSRVVSTIEDDEVLQSALLGLLELGTGHNRFHVRSVCVSILQGIRTTEKALVALDALRRSRRESVVWTLEDFARRSLHPLLRDGIDEILGDE